MSVASVVTRGFLGGVKFVPTRGYASSSTPVSTGSSGVRRLSMYELQSHPQTQWNNYNKRKAQRARDEEAALLSLLASMADEFFDED